MNQGNLPGIDNALAVKAHFMILDDLSPVAFHIIDIGEHGVEALNPRCPSGQQHLATGGHHLNAATLNLDMHALTEVAAGNSTAEHPRAGSNDLVGIHNTKRTLQRRHQQRSSHLNAEFLLGSGNGLVHLTDHSGVFTLGNADAVGPSGHADPDILLPVGCIQAIDPNNDFRIAVVDGFESVVQAEPGGILLVFGHRILQVQNDGIGAVDIGIPDERGFLGVHEHHGTAQPLFVGPGPGNYFRHGRHLPRECSFRTRRSYGTRHIRLLLSGCSPGRPCQ